MAFNTETSRLSQRNKPGAFGPPATFAAVVLLAIAGLGLSVATLPKLAIILYVAVDMCYRGWLEVWPHAGRIAGLF